MKAFFSLEIFRQNSLWSRQVKFLSVRHKARRKILRDNDTSQISHDAFIAASFCCDFYLQGERVSHSRLAAFSKTVSRQIADFSSSPPSQIYRDAQVAQKPREKRNLREETKTRFLNKYEKYFLRVFSNEKAFSLKILIYCFFI